MSKMSNLMLDIEDLLNDEYTPVQIADMMNIEIDLVYDVMDAIDGRFEDGETDDAYALASAGFGTDEDYGGYNDE
jgi:hypothetical protein